MDSEASGQKGMSSSCPTNREDGERTRKRGRPRRTEAQAPQLVAVAYLFAGKTQREAAKLVGVDERTVSRWMKEPAVQREAVSWLSALSAEIWTWIAAEARDVWKVFIDLLHSDDERIRLRACIFYLDRVLPLLPIARMIEDERLAQVAMPPALARLLEEIAEDDGGEAA